jgi:hypothetical protein
MGSSSGSSAGGGYKKPVTAAGGPLRTPSLVALLNQGDAAAGPSGGRPGKSAGGGRTQALFTVPPAGDKAAGEGSRLSSHPSSFSTMFSLSRARARALTFFAFIAPLTWPVARRSDDRYGIASKSVPPKTKSLTDRKSGAAPVSRGRSWSAEDNEF